MIIDIVQARKAIGFGPELDHEVKRLFEAAEADWQRITGWRLSATNDTQTIRPHKFPGRTEPATRLFYLLTRPVTAFGILGWWDGDDIQVAFADTDLVEHEDSRVDLERGELTIVGSVRDQYSVLISGGYDILPPDIEQAITFQAGYRSSRESPELIASRQVSATQGGAVTLRNDQYHPAFFSVASQYARMGY